jgi:ABC-2 type transport system permease protein
MNNLKAIIIKEIKELIRDPKIIIGVILLPLVIFPVMGSAISISQKSVQRTIASGSFAIYTDDNGPVTEALLEYLYTNNIVVPIEAPNLNTALQYFQNTDSNSMIYIPKGYNFNITNGQKSIIKIYANLRKLNMAETESTNKLSGLVNNYNRELSLIMLDNLIQTFGINSSPEAVRNRIGIEYASILKGNLLKIHPSSIYSLILSQSIMLPIMVMMMVMFAIQMAATSIALEKEQKTLETLMTLPVSRMIILTGKLSGSVIIAIAGSVSYLIGFGSYINSAFSFIPEVTNMNLNDLNLGLTPIGFLLVGIVIFVTLISSLSMALSVAVFADDVRSAQSFTSILITPILIPAIIFMFSDIEMLPPILQWVLLIIPYTHSIIATKAAFLGNYFLVMRSIIFISIWTTLLLYLATKVFSTERIITARFTWGRLGEIVKLKKIREKRSTN